MPTTAVVATPASIARTPRSPGCVASDRFTSGSGSWRRLRGERRYDQYPMIVNPAKPYAAPAAPAEYASSAPTTSPTIAGGTMRHSQSSSGTDRSPWGCGGSRSTGGSGAVHWTSVTRVSSPMAMPSAAALAQMLGMSVRVLKARRFKAAPASPTRTLVAPGHRTAQPLASVPPARRCDHAATNHIANPMAKPSAGASLQPSTMFSPIPSNQPSSRATRTPTTSPFTDERRDGNSQRPNSRHGCRTATADGYDHSMATQMTNEAMANVPTKPLTSSSQRFTQPSANPPAKPLTRLVSGCSGDSQPATRISAGTAETTVATARASRGLARSRVTGLQLRPAARPATMARW